MSKIKTLPAGLIPAGNQVANIIWDPKIVFLEQELFI
jgi:hypothetical protein